eukprot:8264375-Karenia_brevis.AAC.1
MVELAVEILFKGELVGEREGEVSLGALELPEAVLKEAEEKNFNWARPRLTQVKCLKVLQPLQTAWSELFGDQEGEKPQKAQQDQKRGRRGGRWCVLRAIAHRSHACAVVSPRRLHHKKCTA